MGRPLHLACFNAYEEIVRSLLEHGAAEDLLDALYILLARFREKSNPDAGKGLKSQGQQWGELRMVQLFMFNI